MDILLESHPKQKENEALAIIHRRQKNFALSVSDLPTQTKKIKSPLRYPGGKTRGVKEIIKYFPAGLKRVCSPFLGGASIELELANRGIEIFGYDIFEPVVAFWQTLLKDPSALATFVKQYHPLSPSKFYSLQREYFRIKSKKQRAAAFFALNRASFSGTTLSGGMSTEHPRFTKACIEQLKDFKLDNFHVEKADFHESLKEHEDDFLYLDPPYLIESKLYGRNGDAHRGFDHEGLAYILTKRNRWILSYNDCIEVRKLYRGFIMLKPRWAYGMNGNKKSNELLILSKDLSGYEY